jgi:hypothetical protein
MKNELEVNIEMPVKVHFRIAIEDTETMVATMAGLMSLVEKYEARIKARYEARIKARREELYASCVGCGIKNEKILMTNDMCSSCYKEARREKKNENLN